MIYGGPCVQGCHGCNVLTKWLRLFWGIQKAVWKEFITSTSMMQSVRNGCRFGQITSILRYKYVSHINYKIRKLKAAFVLPNLKCH
ncbi:hypothetical protein ABIC80_002604 [Kosakonia sp. 1610]